jgi:hypothetical protein
MDTGGPSITGNDPNSGYYDWARSALFFWNGSAWQFY